MYLRRGKVEWIGDQSNKIVEYILACMTSTNMRIEHDIGVRKLLQRAVAEGKVKKKELAGAIDASIMEDIECAKNPRKGAGGIKEDGSRRRRTSRLGGGGRLVVWGDGETWSTTLVTVHGTTGGWEQRMRKLMERWEAPPPGLPSQVLNVCL